MLRHGLRRSAFAAMDRATGRGWLISTISLLRTVKTWAFTCDARSDRRYRQRRDLSTVICLIFDAGGLLRRIRWGLV